jgi:hypothetical protein
VPLLDGTDAVFIYLTIIWKFLQCFENIGCNW